MQRRLSINDELLLVKLYEAGATTSELVARFGVVPASVSQMVRRNGGTVRRLGANRLSIEQERELVDRYERGETNKTLCAAFGVNYTTVSRMVRRLGGTVRPPAIPPRSWTEAEKGEMVRLWTDESMSVNAIADVSGAEHKVVSRILRNAGIDPVPRFAGRSGERSGTWSGGRTVSTGGYVLVWVAPDDPMVNMRPCGTPYVLEHRLVMARHLGRPLLKTETVHHINGVRDDNRLSNLQLRIGAHGKGVVARCASCGSRDIEMVPLD